MTKLHRSYVTTDAAGNPTGLEVPGLFSFKMATHVPVAQVEVHEPKVEVTPAEPEQFAGFAQLLLDELLDVDGVYIDACGEEWEEEWRQLIARRAYDLARHTLESCSKQHRDYGMEPEIDMSTIPDMSTWPEEASE